MTTTRIAETDVAVVGGGPAGLAAALAARAAGASVTLIDEYPALGGQIFKQPRSSAVPDSTGHAGARHAAGADLLRRLAASGAQVWTESLVWAAEAGLLQVRRQGAMCALRCRATVAATGAYELPAVFPGWDLPGVMTPGAAQTLVKTHGLLPGRRIVLAGCGPFLLAVAATLIHGGGAIAGIYELTRPGRWLRHAASALQHPSRIREAAGYLRLIKAAGIPLRFGHRVLRAEGSDALERVVLARCDAEAHPLPGAQTVVQADVLLAGYGFVPANQLTRILGCRHVHDPLRGGWIPERDASLRTSVPGVFVAGEAGGIGGADTALAEGELAGMAAAEHAGQTVDDAHKRAVSRRARRQRAFGDLVNRVFAVPSAALVDIGDETLVCRCEDVSAGQVRDAAAPWAPDVNMVKALTRCGMGYCQGRICQPIVQSLVAERLGLPTSAVGSFSVRPPLKPLAAGDLAACAERVAASAALRE